VSRAVWSRCAVSCLCYCACEVAPQVCRLTFGKERKKLYEALKAAGASYALCFAAANCYGAEV
jgi:hypothetical protein